MTDTLTILRETSNRLRRASDEYEQVCLELAGTPDKPGVAERLTRARLVARAKAFHAPGKKLTVDDMTMLVELDSDVEELRQMHTALDGRARVLKDRMHTDRQILSSWQTQGRMEAELSR